MPGCLRIADRPEHTTEDALSMFLPELSGGPPDVGCLACLLSDYTMWMVGGHRVLVAVANRHDGTPGSLLVKFHTLFLPELSESQLVWDEMPATSAGIPGG